MVGLPDETPEGPPPSEPQPPHTSGRPVGNTGPSEETTDFMGPTPRSVPPTPPEPHHPGTFGRYQVRELRGRGGFGKVYIGFDPQLNRQVAIKVPRVKGEEAEQQFLLEARQLAQLQHPGIVTVYDAGVQAGQFYIVSDYVQGVTLHAWLIDHRPTWREAARIVAEVADALAYAHAHRTVHRDVKPDNIILKDGKTPVLVDFGLAISDEVLADARVRGISGTPSYMSPEQAAGKGYRIDGRTDIYALGVILYRMLCGRLPFQSADPFELLRQVREDDPQPPRQLVPELPPELERICLQALAKRQKDRYTASGDMARDLRAVLESGPDSGSTGRSEPANREADTVRTQLPPSTSRRARQAERRQVTVLFCQCDLFESDAFLEGLDPEDQHEVLTEHKQLCDEAVARFGGTIVQFTSQGLLACFGYPVSYEDAARRAVQAGLHIRDAMRELNERLQKERKGGASVPLQITCWIGIHTGMAVTEETAGGQAVEPMSLVGEVRTVASRMRVTDEPNAVLISQSTQRLSKGFFVCESLGTHPIKGAAQPIELFRVLRESEVKSRIEVAEATGLTPLTGRDMELGILRDRWERASEGMGQVVLLIGDAGLGKSRLVRELRAVVTQGDASLSGFPSGKEPAQVGPVIEWRCSPYHQSTGLHPATDYFERMLGYRREDLPGERLDRLVKHLELYGLAGAERVPLFAALLSVPLDRRYTPLAVGPQRLKEMLQEALLDWLRACSAEQPVLFIVEDLHWVDPTTLEFLTLLIQQAGGDSILSVFTFRPEFETSWHSKAHQTELALSRLTRRQVGEMMEKKIGVANLPAELIDQIVARTDGVPLFIEECTQVLLESSSLRKSGDRVELSEGFRLDTIPATLQDLLLARLNRLESAPEVSQMAAALGREFSYELLHTVLDLDEPILQAELAKLVKAEILFQKGRPPRCNYTFKHALIQDAAYQSLLKKTRQQFHKKIAAVLEEKFTETAEAEPELLARHFTESGLYEKGVFYWRKAGLRSQERSANKEAIVHFSRGLEVLKNLAESSARERMEFGLQAPLAVVLTAARGWGAPEVAPTIERARELCAKIGSITDQFFVLWSLWGFRLLRLELDKCWELAGEVMRLLEGSPEGQELMAEAHWLPGCTAYYGGDFPTALAHFEKGLALYDPQKARAHTQRTGQNVAVLYRCHSALSLWEMGFPDRALRMVEEMVQFARDLGHHFSLAMAFYFRRRLHQYCRLESSVRQSIEEEHTICQQRGFGFWGAHAILARGDVLIRQGDMDAARAQLEPALQALQASGCKCTLTHPYSFLAESFLHVGRPEEAGEWLERGFELVEKHNERFLESELLRLKGEWFLARPPGDEAHAEACFEQASEVARRQRARSSELRAVMSLCRLHRKQGRGEEVRPRLSEIYQGFTEGFETADLVEAKALLGELVAGG
jgi:class 3 adenylate cyclase/tetratricopeptide (TPR) repeat protein